MTTLAQIHASFDGEHDPLDELVLPVIGKLKSLVEVLEGLENVLVAEDGLPQFEVEALEVSLLELEPLEQMFLMVLGYERPHNFVGAGDVFRELGLRESNVAAGVLWKLVANLRQLLVKLLLVEPDAFVDGAELGVRWCLHGLCQEGDGR